MKRLRIQGELLHPVTLTMDDPRKERDFYVYYIHRFLWQLRLAHVLSMVFYLAAVLTEKALINQSSLEPWIRLLSVELTFGTGLVLSYAARKFYTRNYMYFNILYVLLVGLSFVFTASHVPAPFTLIIYSGLLITLVFNYTFIRQSFLYAALAGLAILSFYLFNARILRDPDPFESYLAVYLLIANMLGMIIAYTMELEGKRAYLLLMQSKRDSEQVRHSNRDLEDKVNQRTAELTLAKDQAEESDRLKTLFLKNMSHEIRTPMNGILGFSEFLENPDLTETEKNQYVRFIQSSANQLMRSVDAILEISILESNQVKLDARAFQLNALLEETTGSFRARAEGKKLKLSLRTLLSDPDSIVMSDDVVLGKILGQLLDNAIKFTSEGIIEVFYHIQDGWVQISVRDTGIGISPDYQKRMFKRFSQEEMELSRKFGGLGIGLSIAKEYAQLIGGDLHYVSEKGLGSTFTVEIPHLTGYLEKASRMQEELHADPEPCGCRDDLLVLVAEDEEVNYLYMKEVVERMCRGKVTVLHAWDGNEAIQLCRQHPTIDIILMDLKMPALSGYEATQAIKAFRPRVPILAQTAYSTTDDMKKAKEAGCDDFVTKPIEQLDLCRRIDRLLRMPVSD